jgi:hypothetical protein
VGVCKWLALAPHQIEHRREGKNTAPHGVPVLALREARKIVELETEPAQRVRGNIEPLSSSRRNAVGEGQRDGHDGNVQRLL